MRHDLHGKIGSGNRPSMRMDPGRHSARNDNKTLATSRETVYHRPHTQPLAGPGTRPKDQARTTKDQGRLIMNRQFNVRRLASIAGAALIALGTSPEVRSDGYKPITNEAQFRQAMKDVSNWGRWGAEDELGASNLITPAKRKQAAALVREGTSVSLEIGRAHV